MPKKFKYVQIRKESFKDFNSLISLYHIGLTTVGQQLF